MTFVLIGSGLSIGTTAAQGGDTRSYYDSRVSFTYSMQIAQDAISHWVPATTDPNVPTGLVPEYTEIDFQNYFEGTGWVNSGQMIHVYPVVTFPTDPSQPYTQALVNLRNVLTARPNAPLENLPMLPVVTAMPYFHSQVQYVDFAGGSGIRYVTAAGLDVSPLSNDRVFYSFQGLTSDGAYYIAAMIPVKTPILPDVPESMDAEQYNQFASNFETYIADITTQLNGLPPQSFVPDLSLLDAAMSTFQIDTPDAMIVSTPGTVPVAYNDVRFGYDSTLAQRVEVDNIAPFVDTEGMSMYGSLPGWTQFTFMNYPLLSASSYYAMPQIFVYPVDGFPKSGSIVDQQLSAIQSFLAARAPQTARLNSTESIPALPLINAAQVLVAKPQYLDFQNGSGIRFITTYAQTPYPVTNRLLLYQFVGLTADGRYLIGAKFPIAASVLPDDLDPATFNFDDFMATFDATMNQTVVSLDTLDASGYTPNLDTLDALIQSLMVG
jgi:hypothetical protein